MDRSNTQAFNDAEKYSNFVIQTLPDILLPENMYRDVSDFADGTNLNIATVGSVALQEVTEGVPLNFTDIDSGTVTLQITDYEGDAWAVSDEARQDIKRLSVLEAARAMESTRAIAEYRETRLLEVCNQAQTNNDPNTINGVPHRIASAETGGVVTLDHFRKMKYAFDKARVPQGGRIAIVDPSVEYILNASVQVTSSDNPHFEGIVTEGFAQSHRFIRNIYGWDIWTSDMLDKGTFGDGTTTISNTAVANVFMSVLSDQHAPIMFAERLAPKVTGWRDEEERRDKFQTVMRSGYGPQRVDTLGILITDANQV